MTGKLFFIAIIFTPKNYKNKIQKTSKDTIQKQSYIRENFKKLQPQKPEIERQKPDDMTTTTPNMLKTKFKDRQKHYSNTKLY